MSNLLEFLETQKFKNPVQMGKALVRPMIKAPKDHMLIVSDYSSIENRVLALHAGDKQTLIDFENGIDQYKTMAASKYGVHYDDVTNDQRFMGKVIILGCGYQMGGDTFQKTCKEQFGFDVSIEEAKQAVSDYREKYHLVKALWKGLQQAAVRAVMTGKRQTYNTITFGTSTVNDIRWLAMLMPSGKCVYYKNPQIRQQFIPKYEHMGKVPTVTAEGRNPYTKKWSRLPLTPGRITENATQGFAREIMAEGMLNVQNEMPEVTLIGSVHDEALGLIHKDDLTNNTMDTFNKHLCNIPFATECPIKAVGYISERYKKD